MEQARLEHHEWLKIQQAVQQNQLLAQQQQLLQQHEGEAREDNDEDDYN